VEEIGEALAHRAHRLVQRLDADAFSSTQPFKAIDERTKGESVARARVRIGRRRLRSGIDPLHRLACGFPPLREAHCGKVPESVARVLAAAAVPYEPSSPAFPDADAESWQGRIPVHAGLEGFDRAVREFLSWHQEVPVLGAVWAQRVRNTT